MPQLHCLLGFKLTHLRKTLIDGACPPLIIDHSPSLVTHYMRRCRSTAVGISALVYFQIETGTRHELFYPTPRCLVYHLGYNRTLTIRLLIHVQKRPSDHR